MFCLCLSFRVDGWKVLVMDPLATRVISSVLTMYDIMENKVTLVEKLHLNRQPFADMDVIYLALPTVEAAQRISKDFESRSKAKYNNVHLFFLENVSCVSLSHSILRTIRHYSPV